MNTEAFIDWCIHRSISFSLDGDSLKVHSEPGTLNEEVLTELRSRKSELVSLLKTRKDNIIVPRSQVEEALPLSYSQQRLWIIDQLEGDTAHYNMTGAFKIEGRCDVGIVEKVFRRIIERHEILRTSFKAHDNGVVQIPARDFKFEVNTIDLSDQNDEETENSVHRAICTQSVYSFDLVEDFLIRVSVLKCDVDRSVLIINMHHIVSDAWSLDVISKEFIQLYCAFYQKRKDPLPLLKIQYADYALWQREHLQGEQFSAQLKYWCNRLKDLPDLHGLPIDKTRPKEQNYTAGCIRQAIDSELYQSIKEFALKKNVTHFMFLQTAFALLLNRYSGEDDIVMGVPCAGRNNRETVDLVGFFVNLLVFRTSFSENVSFDTLLETSKKNSLSAFANQDVPFELLVDQLKPDRTLAYNPICQIKFMLHTQTDKISDFSNLNIVPIDNKVDTVRFDFDLSITESSKGLVCAWTYKKELFKTETIKKIADNFLNLLRNAIRYSEREIADISIFDEFECNALIAKGQGDEVEFPSQSLIELIECQAGLHPDDIVVVGRDHKLSYFELSVKSNRLADFLIEQDVSRGDSVAIYLERSPVLLLAVLAVMKTGAAYIPLDSTGTHDRIQHILQDAGVEQVLTSQCLLGDLPVAGVDIISLDDWYQPNWLSEYNSDRSYCIADANDCAYVIYTSGSTGKPKGVEISHRSLTDYCQFASSSYYQRYLTGSFVITSHAFDITVPSIFLPLLNAGSVELLDSVHTFEMLARRLAVEPKAYLLRMTPMHVEALLALLPEPCYSEAKHVFVVGGESFQVNLATRLQVVFPHSTIYNHYGPTEATVGCSMHRFSNARSYPGNTLPIGRPMGNHTLYVLSKTLQLVPAGGEGELYVAGAGLAKGYLKQPDLSREKFIDNPYGKGKAYATGDRVKWNEHGDLEFCGRIDEQIKLRGYRIEPGEIEYRLLQCENVSSCLVAACEDQADQQHLVAYVIIDFSGKKEDLDERALIGGLRTQLKMTLPDYMVPSTFVLIDNWPLAASGKIDKLALPIPNSRLSERSYLEPETETERALTQIWGRLLKHDAEKISVSADFFDLGGNSLLAIRLIAEIRRDIRAELTVKSVFDTPTLSDLAAAIDRTPNTELRRSIEAVERDSDRVPLSFSQQRLWFIDQLREGSPEYNMPAAYSVHGDFDASVAQRSLQQIIERHEILRTVYRETNEGVWQIVQNSFEFEIARHDLTTLTGEHRETELQRLIDQHALRSFDLTRDLMVRASFIQLDKGDGGELSSKLGVLLVNMHHIAADGWSLRILIREFTDLYQAIVRGKQPSLPKLDIQYADYAMWQKQWLDSRKMGVQIAYWDKQLADVPPVHSVPLDKPRAMAKQYTGGRITSELKNPIAQKLYAVAKANKLTPFMLLHGALALVLSRHSNSDDIVVGTPVANRLQVELEPLIGFFVNTLVLRVDTAHEQLDSYLRHIRQVHLDAQTHQDVPFEQLVERLNIARTPSHTPLFQIMLTTDTQYGIGDRAPEDLLRLFDVRLSPLPHNTITAKFDLELDAVLNDKGVSLNWVYDEAIFTREHIVQLDDHLSRLLTSLAELSGQTSEGSTASLAMLSEVETRYLLHTVNDTYENYPIEQCLHELFLAKVVSRHNAIALRDSEGIMTYGELFSHAYAVYEKLAPLGIFKEELVAIRLEKGRWQIIAALGVMMAGAAYLPMETNWPAERCLSILKKATCRFLLLNNREHVITEVENLFLSDLSITGCNATKEASEFNLQQTPGDLAYVIFTSGSTGEPKGVAIEHRSAVNTILDINSQYKVTEKDKVLAVSALSFDLSVYDLFGLLAAGGEIIFPEHDKAMDPAHWLDMIETHHVTLWDTVPFSASLLAEQLEYRKRASTAPIRNLLMSGDWIDPGLPKRLWQIFPEVKIWSLGGATEGSIWSIHYPISRDTSGLKSIPYGKPLSNQRFYILNENRKVTPPGISGELCIAGEGVARCYFGDAPLTAERFIYHQELNQKIYRTGDLGRYMPDGNIEFLGRKDDQIKINGFRIELGEVEQKLGGCAAVESCLVRVKEGLQGQHSLIAYVLPSTDGIDATSDLPVRLKHQLRKMLPGYMVPDIFLIIERWPLTSNGKIDHKSLPMPEEPLLHHEYYAPETESERQLVVIWAELLNLPEEKISTKVGFFDIHGNSLLATRMVFKIKQSMSIKMELHLIYSHDTIQTMAALIDYRQSLKAVSASVGNLNESEVEEFLL